MRRILAALSLPALAASTQPAPADEAAPTGRDGIRQSAIETCMAAAREAAPRVIAEFDWSELCGCATERVMAGRSDSALRQIAASDQRDAVRACIAEARRDRPAGQAPAKRR